MKIIYLHQYFLTPTMAGGTRSYELARRLVAAGHTVDMITTDQAPAASGPRWRVTDEQGIRVHWARIPYGNEMGFVQRVRAFLEFAVAATRRALSLRGDVIYATSTPLTIAIPALVASRVRRTPFVFEVRDMWPDVPIALGAIRNPVIVWAARKLEMLAYRRAAHVVALAPGMREDIIAKGIAPEKVTVVPNGCDLDVFAALVASDIRQRYAWLGGRKLVVYAGALGKVNDVGYLARVAERLRHEDPEIRIVVIGKGGDEQRVRQTAEQLGVLGLNFFMLPAMPKRELAAWLHEADLLVALFTGPRMVWKDGVQNKFFDALAAGKPIANNFDGWQAHVAEEAGVGIRLNPDDVGAAAREMARALNDEGWLAAVPTRARTLAAGRFNRDNLARELETVLTRVGSGR